MPRLAAINRYPIKSLSAEPLNRVAVEAGRPLPSDRMFALSRAGGDTVEAPWAHKTDFLVLMSDAELASSETRFDTATRDLEVRSNGETVLSANAGTAHGRSRIGAFFGNLVPGLSPPPSFVRSADGHFMDSEDNVISLLNLATVRALDEEWGTTVDPRRFRMNLHIDGAAPWQEFDWIDREITIGGTRFDVVSRVGRCAATNVNPVTAERDTNIPFALRKSFGHLDCGVYLVAKDGGEIAVGDDVAATAP